jgi:hypothetical protein
MTDENAVLYVSCLLRKHIDVETMSIYLMAFGRRLLLLLLSLMRVLLYSQRLHHHFKNYIHQIRC